MLKGLPIEGIHPEDLFGWSVDLNDDGTILAVGAPGADGTDELFSFAGEVSIYRWSGADWNLTDVITRDEEMSGFGWSVRLNADGDRVLITAPFYDLDPTTQNVGAIIVYEDANQDGDWNPLGTPVVGREAGDWFGSEVDFSSDGQRIIASSYIWMSYRGEVRVLQWDGSTWHVEMELFGSEPLSVMGTAVTIDGTGSHAAVANLQDSDRIGISIYERSGSTWSLSDTIGGPPGSMVAVSGLDMSDDGNTILSVWSIGGEEVPLIVFKLQRGIWSQFGDKLVSAAHSTFPPRPTANDPGTNSRAGHAIHLSPHPTTCSTHWQHAPDDSPPSGSKPSTT